MVTGLPQRKHGMAANNESGGCRGMPVATVDGTGGENVTLMPPSNYAPPDDAGELGRSFFVGTLVDQRWAVDGQQRIRLCHRRILRCSATHSVLLPLDAIVRLSASDAFYMSETAFGHSSHR